MAFLDELEKMIFGSVNTTDGPELQEILKIANESKNLSLNQEGFNENTVSSIWGRIFLIFAYGVIIAISLFGNTLVCHVILKNRRMRTVTNLFIANLAVSDLLLTCINVPFNIARNLLDDWPFGSVLCHLLNFSLMVSSYVSTFTLLGIALDRQQVLLYPLNPRMSKPIGICIIILIWLLAIGLSLPFGLYNKVQTVDFFFTRVQRCTSAFPEPSDKWEKYLTISTLLLQYMIPLTVIGVTYGRIVRKLWVRTHVGAVTENQQVSQQKAKRKSIKMLIVVVVVFALCWMPLNLYQVLADFDAYHFSSTSFFICHWIAISSTCYNPFVYCWLNEAFRQEVKSRFKCCFPKPKRVHPGVIIDGLLYRTDRSYHRRHSKSNSSKIKTSIQNRPSLLPNISSDSNIMSMKEQSEERLMSPETIDTPVSDASMTGTSSCGPLEPLYELSEQLSDQCCSEHIELQMSEENGTHSHHIENELLSSSNSCSM